RGLGLVLRQGVQQGDVGGQLADVFVPDARSRVAAGELHVGQRLVEVFGDGRDPVVPAAGVAELGLEVRDAGDAPGELPLAVQAVQLADTVVRGDHERRLLRLENLRDGLDRRHFFLAVEILVALHTLDGFRGVHFADDDYTL